MKPEKSEQPSLKAKTSYGKESPLISAFYPDKPKMTATLIPKSDSIDPKFDFHKTGETNLIISPIVAKNKQLNCEL